MLTRVAINGFGRIGRCVLRAAHERGSGLEIVADANRLVALAERVLAPAPAPTLSVAS